MEQIQLFTKGFNDGFLIAKYEGDTAKQLSSIPQRSAYTMGLVSGIEEVYKDLKLMREFRELRNNTLSPDKNMGR